MSAKDDIWKGLTPDDLEGDLKEVAKALGMPAIRYLVESWGGLQIYVTSERALLKSHIRAAIRKEWTGRNDAELAKKYGIPRRQVVEALQADPPAPDPAQQSLPLG